LLRDTIFTAVGGWINDRFGRKKAILIADTLFFIGSAIMAGAMSPHLFSFSVVFVGLDVGMASLLYISEASPTRVRGALVSLNGFLIIGGQFLSYLINSAFPKVSNFVSPIQHIFSVFVHVMKCEVFSLLIML
jgi:MFS transporter, SP family, solute carrier family 2 (myo-inositol transporter), member 13